MSLWVNLIDKREGVSFWLLLRVNASTVNSKAAEAAAQRITHNFVMVTND
jgi:hypothetical protein